MTSASHPHGPQSHNKLEKGKEMKSKFSFDNAQAVIIHDSQTGKEKRRKKKLRHKANLEHKRLEAQRMENFQKTNSPLCKSTVQVVITQKKLPDPDIGITSATKHQKVAKDITISGAQTISDDSIPQKKGKKNKKKGQQAVTVIKPQALYNSPMNKAKVIGRTQSSKGDMNTSNNKRKLGHFESLETKVDSQVSTAGFHEGKDEEAPKKKKNKVKESKVQQQEGIRQSTLEVVPKNAILKEKKQAPALVIDPNHVSIQEIESCLAHHRSQQGISPSSKTYMVPVYMLPSRSQETKEGNLVTSIAKKAVFESVGSSSDDGDNVLLTDIKPASSLRTSAYVSGQRESPIVPPAKAYQFQRDTSLSPTARLMTQQKESRITPAKKYAPVGTDIKTELTQKSKTSDFIIEKVDTSSSDDESLTVRDSDEESEKSIKKFKLSRSLAKEQRMVEHGENEECIEEAAHISGSSLEPSSKNDEFGVAQKLNYTAILPPPGKKETPIPPPKPLSIKTYARSSQNSTPLAAVNATLPTTSIKPSCVIRTQAPKLLPTTPIPTPLGSATKSTKPVTKPSPPSWLTGPLERFNSAIKASRAGESGWKGLIQGGDLESGFRMALDGDSDGRPGRKKLRAKEIKSIADDWKKVPGRIRANVGTDDGDVVENIAYSSTYLASRPTGVSISTTFAQTTFLTLNLSPTDSPQALSNLNPTELMICTVMKSKVQVTLAGAQFVVSKGGMWRIRGGEECEVRYFGKALSEKCAVVLGVVVKQVAGAVGAITTADEQ